jgi:hypothetical protein
MTNYLAWFLSGVVVASGCGSVSDRTPDAEISDDSGGGDSDAGGGGASDAGIDGSVDIDAGDAMPAPVCTANQALRCDGGSLVRCNSDGTGEIRETCALGCNANAVRCNDVNPSNSLAPLLDMTTGEPVLDLGASAVLNTDTGAVMVDNSPVVVKSVTLAQASAPTIRVFIVRRLTAIAVTVTGSNALAIVSNGEISIDGVFAASADFNRPGAGAFNDGACRGAPGGPPVAGGAAGGAGGGAFGLNAGRGGSAMNNNGTSAAGNGGTATGNPTLTPLRGGCDSGTVGASVFGAGGGAIQLVSRTRITVSGVVAANGASGSGGGSGGGILLEAPAVQISGAVVANGGGGAGGCFIPRAGEDGRLDATPASGGTACDSGNGRDGGAGGAGNQGARNGISLSVAGSGIAFAGAGGGSVGRIRVNTVSGGLGGNGVFSPNPTTGVISTR